MRVAARRTRGDYSLHDDKPIIAPPFEEVRRRGCLQYHTPLDSGPRVISFGNIFGLLERISQQLLV